MTSSQRRVWTPRRLWWFGEGDDRLVYPENGPSQSFHAATVEWVRALGLDPARLAPEAVVVEHDGRCELHVDEVVRDSSGYDRADPMTGDKLLTIRRIVPVERDSWPPRPAEVVAEPA